MVAAMKAVVEGSSSVSKAAREHGVPIGPLYKIE